MSNSPAFDSWIAQARAVSVADVTEQRGIQLRGGKDRAGPCPRCGGTDRFSINLTKNVFFCRGCEAKGDVIALVRFLDGVDFMGACENLAGAPPPPDKQVRIKPRVKNMSPQGSTARRKPKPNGKDAEPRAAAGNGAKIPIEIPDDATERIVDSFEYHDADRHLRFVVERREYQRADGTWLEGKKLGKNYKVFRQKRPHPDYTGRWIHNVEGIDVELPYRLPDILAALANERTIVICEGERKADLLWQMGIPATTNAMGSGKWRAGHSKFFQDVAVIILPDADAAGHAHADKVAKSLQGIASSVRLLELPGLAEGEDVEDWVARGGTAEQLHGLLEQAELWIAPEADEPEADEPDQDGVSQDDFFAYMPMHSYIYVPTREMWPASSVNARLPLIIAPSGKPIAASDWLDRTRPVEQMTWAPGLPMLIKDKLVADGGWIEHGGVSCFNLYRAPEIKLGDPNNVELWLAHMHRIYGADTDHLIKWLAHRVQRPHEKINHAILLGGAQGIGKDTLLEPVKKAIGAWNFAEVSPQQLLGRFNGFLKSVILRVSEARDLGDVNRFGFYEHLKAFTAAPPDVLRIDEKHLREHSILNVVGVVITTNYKTGGIYLPADDRRHYVAWSSLTKDALESTYFTELWRWYANGGIENVAAFLHTLDLASFDPKMPPPKTAAFWDIVDANRAPEDAELADTLDRMGNPDAVTLLDVSLETSDAAFAEWLRDRKNRRVVPHRFEQAGYVSVRNDAANDGLWKLKGRRQVIYAKAVLSFADQLRAVRKLTQ